MTIADRTSTAPPNDFRLPHRLRRLPDLAYNLWWTWNPETQRVFELVDPVLWEATAHNPVTFLRRASRERLNAVMHDRDYLQRYDKAVSDFQEYMAGDDNTWYATNQSEKLHQLIAYFSSEFGLHESLPIYAGGLGILSGDHLKEASDLGLPMVAVGFLYTQGYFKQRITEDGWQEAEYANLSFPDLPVSPVQDQDGQVLMVGVELAGRQVYARLWRVQVGRVPLLLLDSNVEMNHPEDRHLTARLYTSDIESRISQEILLGFGGVRALRALGYHPAVWHLNEGHSAFNLLERMREHVAEGMSPDDAQRHVVAHSAFTTHTPVAAGHDEFPLWLIDKYFSHHWPQMGLEREAFIDLARGPQAWGETFGMARLAMKLSSQRNAVSLLHGQTARRMWAPLWPNLPEESTPIHHVTNGVHTCTWLARRMKILFDRHLGPSWLGQVDDPETWEGVDQIPDAELWELRRHLKRKMVAYIRERARGLWLTGRVHPVQVIAGGVLLDPYALTIGFARRFATYKRADLIFHDPERLLELVSRPDRPIQLIFAGKAHPADEPAKRLIQTVYHHAKKAENTGRIVFIEDYDMNLARYLLQGVDVWLNTPRRPNEASGTSGQKAVLNGVINFSVLDGWWKEGYNGRNGWIIGTDQGVEDPASQDRADAESLYHTLEHEIIPLYYLERSADDLPGEWLGMIKESIRSIAPFFNTRRMLKEYVEKMYLPSIAELEPN